MPAGERRAAPDACEGVWGARREPDRRLTGRLARELLGYGHQRPGFAAWLEPAEPVVTLIVDLEGELYADERRLPGAWLGGLPDAGTRVGVSERYAGIDLKLHPLGAYTLTGGGLHELAGRCVSLTDLLGADADRLVARLHDAEDWPARFDALETFLAARLAQGPAPDPVVVRAWRRLGETDGQLRIGALAAELRCSRRHLQERFRTQIGVVPKTAARLLRFGAVRRPMTRDPVRWGDVAAAAGYADQSHLNRDFRQLAGTTPTAFLASLRPGDRAGAELPGGGVRAADLS